MKIEQYIGYLIKDFIMIYGSLMVIISGYLALISVETITLSIIWQIVMVTLAFTFYKYAFTNKLDLGKKAHLISFFVSATLGDLLIIMWLFLFTPGRINRPSLMISYIIVMILVKGMVYAMLYHDGKVQAKKFNEKLTEIRSNSKKI